MPTNCPPEALLVLVLRGFPASGHEYCCFLLQVATWHVTHPDGVEIFHFPNGQVEAHHPTGLKEIIFPDGVLRRLLPSG